MATNRRYKKTQTPPYPQNADEWRDAIAHSFSLTPAEGKARYQADTFPFEAFTEWLQQEFSAEILLSLM